MRALPPSEIETRKRQRTEFGAEALEDLKNSILEKGLFHAPLVRYDGASRSWVLVAGERRLRALCSIIEEGGFFLYDGHPFADGTVPVTELNTEEADPDEAELEENIIRVDLSMPDKARALTLIQEKRRAQAKESEPVTDTEIAKRLEQGGGIASGPKSLSGIRHALRHARVVTEHLDDPAVAKARSLQEAYNLALRRDEEAVNAALSRIRAKRRGAEQLDIEVKHGDLFEVLPTLPEHSFDLILTDPPYGIDADSAGFRQRTPHAHSYDDSFKAAREILQVILLEGHRVTKPAANLFIFTDYDHFDWLWNASTAAGWEPWRRPLIWQKSLSEGLRPWGRGGPAIVHELFFFARKGTRGLIKPFVDVQFAKRVPRDERTFAAEKPLDLIERLLDVASLPGDRVLDPCLGSGTTLVAAKRLGRSGFGIEKDRATYNTAVSRIFKEQEEKNDD